MHVDADCFFVSVAIRHRPWLAGRPVVVGDPVVACASYPARAAGVRAGTSLHEARRTCPEVLVLPIPTGEVEEVSDQLFRVLDELVPAVEPGSMEEAFLDTSALSWRAAEALARHLRRRVREELGIGVTAGIGRTKLMAKTASRAAKPDGLGVITPEQEDAVRRGTLLRDLWGVGERTSSRLEGVGVTTLPELDRLTPRQLHDLCGTTMARRLRQMADGTDDAVVRGVRARRTLTAETSTAGWGRPDRSPAELADVVVERVAHRAVEARLLAGVVAVLLRPDDGPQLVRRARLPEPTAQQAVLRSVVAELLERSDVPPLEALAVTLSDLVPADREQQATLF